MRTLRFALLAVLVAGIAPPARAQMTDPALIEAVRGAARGGADESRGELSGPGAVLAGKLNPNEYRMGPGDVIRLTVWGQVTRSEEIGIGPEGTLVSPLFGSLALDGLTLTEARRRILEAVRREMRNVQIDVQLSRPRRFMVHRTGQVRQPGPAETSTLERVSDVLPPSALADNASRRRIEVLRRSGQRLVADVELFLLTGDAAQNPWLEDGDILNVPVATEFIWASGAVARGGRFELGVHDSLHTLIRLAGGIVPAASNERGLLVRWSGASRPESLWVNLDDVVAGRVDPPLHDGDRFYAYFVPNYREQPEVGLYGEVQRPGPYPIIEGVTRLSNLVKAGGGFLPAADLGAIRVIRPLPGQGERDAELDRLIRLSSDQLTASEYEKLRTKLAEQREGYRVDWERVINRGDEVDLLLRNGDVVRVEKLVSSIRIDGEVRRPGILAYRPGYTVDDYVRQAGGYAKRAWTNRVRITRSVTGQALYARDVVSIGPGDFVWVPEKPDRDWSRAGLTIVTALASIATVALAIATVNRN